MGGLDISPGRRWYPEIERTIKHSRVALLLVSADYLAPDFIMGDELPALCRYGVQLAPVLVSDCLLEGGARARANPVRSMAELDRPSPRS